MDLRRGNGDRRAVAVDVLSDQLSQREVADIPTGVVPLQQDSTAFDVTDEVQPLDRQVEITGDLLEDPRPPCEEPRDGRPVEQIGGVLDEAREVPAVSRVLREGDQQVEAGRSRARRQRAHGRAGHGQVRFRRVLEHHRDLEHRVVRRRTVRVQYLHQVVERDVLVREGTQAPLPYPAHQFAEGRVT